MYTIQSSIIIYFGHHVRGHDGPCISLHGHTWKFELGIQAKTLDKQGFVVDFDRVHGLVLGKCHQLLDHGLALGEATWAETKEHLAPLGEALVNSRKEIWGNIGKRQPGLEGSLANARNEWPGGIKIAVFPFTPTSERLAEWLYQVSDEAVSDDRVSIAYARVYETLNPTESVAEYRPD